MSEPHALWVMLVGAGVVLAALIQSAATSLRIPAVVGFILLGVLARIADDSVRFLTPPVREAFAFLSDLGVVALLFRVGLESKLGALLALLPRAVVVWVSDVALSSAAGFAVARYVLELALLPSLVVGVALSVTSIGVSLAAWRDARLLDSPEGRLTLDVAELDDLSGVVLLSMLFAAVPLIESGAPGLGSTVARTLLLLLGKLVLLGAFCVAFARFAEPRITAAALRLQPAPARMLVVAGIGFMIAALADALGFSLAVGALFAGLVFSRDPAAVKVEARFDDLHAFFAPFFFIGIGLSVPTEVLPDAALPGLALLGAAIAGKLLGGGIPALAFSGVWGAAAVGTSLIPRAEISLYVASTARAAGDRVLSGSTYSALVFVSLATSLLAPVALRVLLHRRDALGGGR